MKIKAVVEQENGVFEFSAELSPQQHTFLLEYALRDLIRKGLMPFVTADKESDLVNVIPQSYDTAH